MKNCEKLIDANDKDHFIDAAKRLALRGANIIPVSFEEDSNPMFLNMHLIYEEDFALYEFFHLAGVIKGSSDTKDLYNKFIGL